MLPAARNPSFQTEDISILKQRAVWNCVKMSMILLFYYVESRRLSDETGFIFQIYLLLVDHSEILVFNKALPKSFFSALNKARPVFLSTALFTSLVQSDFNLKTKQ